jgi:hypothetical protein
VKVCGKSATTFNRIDFMCNYLENLAIYPKWDSLAVQRKLHDSVCLDQLRLSSYNGYLFLTSVTAFVNGSHWDSQPFMCRCCLQLHSTSAPEDQCSPSWPRLSSWR